MSIPNAIFKCKILYLSVSLKTKNKNIPSHSIKMEKNSQTKASIYYSFQIMKRVRISTSVPAPKF